MAPNVMDPPTVLDAPNPIIRYPILIPFKAVIRNGTVSAIPPSLTLADAEKITQRNATKSPLLKLPGELRNRIYYLALSGSVLKVQHHGTQGGFRTIICSERSAEDDAAEVQDGRWNCKAACYRWCLCGLSQPRAHELMILRRRRLAATLANQTHPWALLAVCRQTYAECRLAPLASNTFLFDRATALNGIVASLNNEQAAMLTTLHLHEDLGNGSDFGSEFKIPSPGIVERLVGVRSLYVTIGLSVTVVLNELRRPDPSWKETTEMRWIERFGKLNLEKVVVAVQFWAIGGLYKPSNRLMARLAREADDLARKVQHLLLEGRSSMTQPA